MSKDYSVDPCEHGVMRPECEVCCAADARMWASIQRLRRQQAAEREMASPLSQSVPGRMSFTVLEKDAK